MPVTPVPLVAYLMATGAATEEELRVRAEALIASPAAQELTLLAPTDDGEDVVAAGLRTLMERGMLTIGPDGQLQLSEEGRRIVEFYAASVAHLLDERGEKTDEAPFPGAIAAT
jgi:glycerol-3-phosphate O-acyltransferase